MAKKRKRKTKKQKSREKTKKQQKKDLGKVKRIKMKVVGIGNGGGTIVADIAKDVKRAKFLAANTDKLALSKLKRKIKTFQFGQELTGGLGAGMDVDLGRQAAEQTQDKIEKILGGCDLCILVACLGGGTGSGAVPVFARISKELGNLTYGIFTLPFEFEGQKKIDITSQALKELEPFVNAITLVPNERIFKVVDEKIPLKKALSTINEILAFNLGGLIEMIYKPGIINIDFADLKTILKKEGQLAYLKKATAQGEERAKKACHLVLASPLYPYNISQATRVLFNIAGPVGLSISEVAEISEGIFGAAGKRARIIFGVSQKNGKKAIEVTLLAVGCEMKNFFPVSQQKKKGKIKRKTRKKRNKKKKKKKKFQETSTGKKKPKTQKPIRQKKEIPSQAKKEKKEQIVKGEKEKQSGEAEAKKERVRKNGLQVQKDVEELEREIRKKEEAWEPPAFLRKKHSSPS